MIVAEDEPAISDLLSLYFERAGYRVHVAKTGSAALDAARRERPVALVLDVGLPEMEGTDVCRTLRAEGNWVPIVFCTARDDEVDRILGLELGADDYVTKPFSPKEVVARVRAVLRRAEQTPSALLTMGAVTVDCATRRVYVADQPVHLTATEFDLLAHLIAHPGQVVTRDELLAEVWGYRSPVPSRTVDVHVAQLRAKLGDVCPIRTVRGVGYASEAP